MGSLGINCWDKKNTCSDCIEIKIISHSKFQSSGTDPKEALDKALFEQMQQMSNKKKEAVRVRKILSTRHFSGVL